MSLVMWAAENSALHLLFKYQNSVCLRKVVTDGQLGCFSIASVHVHGELTGRLDWRSCTGWWDGLETGFRLTPARPVSGDNVIRWGSGKNVQMFSRKLFRNYRYLKIRRSIYINSSIELQ